MASVEKPGLWSFATLPMPIEPTGSYQTAGTLLKVAGWIRLVQLVLVVLVGAMALLMLAFAGAIGGAFLPMAGRWGLPAGALGTLVLMGVAFAVLVAIAVTAAMTYWTSWIYAKWVGKDPRAPKHVFAYGVVTVVLSALGALGGLGGNPTSLIDVGLVVIGILLIIESRKPEHEGFGGQMPVRAEGWQDVE